MNEIFRSPDLLVSSLQKDPVSPVTGRYAEGFFDELQVLLKAGEEERQFTLAVKNYFNGLRKSSLFSPRGDVGLQAFGLLEL